jgi:hypothetical protein
MVRGAVVAPSGVVAGRELSDGVSGGLERLAGAEEAERSRIEAAGSAGVVELWEAHVARWRGELAARVAMQEVEQAEAAGRSRVAEAQWAEAMVLAAEAPAQARRLAAARAAAEARGTQLEAVEEALESREAALARVERELEAVRESAAGSSDGEVAGREVGRQEAEGRAAVAVEQRAVWAWVQEAERAGRAWAAQRAVERVVEAEGVGRLAIAEAEAQDLDLGSVVSELRRMARAPLGYGLPLCRAGGGRELDWEMARANPPHSTARRDREAARSK